MLKKIMKAALAASLVFGMSSVATAETKVSTDVHAYYGQYNSGADGYTAHFINATEAHVSLSGGDGPIKGFMQVEARSDAATQKVDSTGTDITSSKNNLNNAQLAVTYTTGALSVKVGTVSNGATCFYALSNGLGTTTTASYGTYVKCVGYHEADGIQVGFMLPAISGQVQLSIWPSTGGQDMAVSAAGLVAGMVQFKLNSTTETTDDYGDSTDTATTDSALNVGVKVLLSKAMNISLETGSTKTDAGAKTATNGLQFAMAGVGPGEIVVTYGMDSEEDAAGNAGDAVTYTGLTYRIGMGKGVSADFFYASKGTTPDGGDTTTSSWIGGGLEAAF